jgi:serine protein kinase
MGILDRVKERHRFDKIEEMSLQDYLKLCKNDSSAYASPAERLLKAIGEPKIVETINDPRLSRIFLNRTIRMYPAFEEFYGMEDTIDNIVSFLKHNAQHLEEKKQVLYLLGPVGGGKSSIAERLKKLMEKEPIYVLKAGDILSPIHESPLGLFSPEDSEELGIPSRVLTNKVSPWARKRLKEFNGDITQFTVVKMFPSQADQIAISKTEPGDENNQDISTLVGKIDIRKLAKLGQNDPDAYCYSGGLCLGNRGILEFVEMFKAPIKVLHPLLTATQEGNYNGTEAISSIPFDGIILAHSNEAEWQTFRNDKNNEAFLDRIYIVKVPYCLRFSEETNIYKKLIRDSSLKTAPCASETLEMLAKFCVLTRLKEPENSTIVSKLRVYDGENVKEKDVNAKSLQEYKDLAGVDEGFTGLSTRFAYKILSKTFNFDATEVAANPVHLMYILETQLLQEQLPKDTYERCLNFIKKYLQPEYLKFIEKEINTAYLESYSDYGQNLFDRYVQYADMWIQDQDFKDPDTGQLLNRDLLNKELEGIEKAAGITNVKDFRNETVNFVLRARAKGRKVHWTDYNKLKEVIEKKMFASTEDILPVIAFGAHASKEDQRKHDEFVDRMVARGYTKKQVKLLVDWYLRVKKS